MSSAEENLRDRGRRLRAELTYEERKLWAHLRAKCWVAQHLIIELDDSQHAEPEEERKDGLRTAHLNRQGYRVLRFWNEQINRELEGVLQAVYAALTDSQSRAAAAR